MKGGEPVFCFLGFKQDYKNLLLKGGDDLKKLIVLLIFSGFVFIGNANALQYTEMPG